MRRSNERGPSRAGGQGRMARKQKAATARTRGAADVSGRATRTASGHPNRKRPCRSIGHLDRRIFSVNEAYSTPCPKASARTSYTFEHCARTPSKAPAHSRMYLRREPIVTFFAHLANRSRNLPRTCTGLALALVLALAGTAAAPQAALAATSQSDIICGKSATERQIQSADLPDISAQNAIIITKDGTSYYERAADSEVKIASTTKIMTAIVVLENANLDDTLTVSKKAADTYGSSADIEEGDKLTVEQALRGLLIPSGNDAAVALAEYVGKKLDSSSSDPEATFVKEMNRRAKELGCEHTVFENPSGLDADEYAGNMHSTARDLSLMVKQAMTNDTYRKIVADSDSTIKVTGADGTKRSWEMKFHNTLLGKDGNIGGKTGTTYAAGYCFACAYDNDGDEIYVIVLHSSDDGMRYTDTAALASWYYGHQKSIDIVSCKRKVAGTKNPLVARVALSSWSDKTVDATVAKKDRKVRVFSLKGELAISVNCEPHAGSAAKGDKLGTVSISQEGTLLKTVDLVAAEDEPAPNPIEWVLVKIDRAFRSSEGRELCANSEILADAPVA